MPVAKGWECPSDFAPHLNLYIVLSWLQEGERGLTLVHLNAAQASMEGRREDTPNRGPSPSESPESGSSSPGVRLGNRRSPQRQSLDRGKALSFKLLRSEVVLLGLAALAALSYGSFLFGKQLSGGSVFDAADAQVRKSRSKVPMRWGEDREIAPLINKVPPTSAPLMQTVAGHRSRLASIQIPNTSAALPVASALEPLKASPPPEPEKQWDPLPKAQVWQDRGGSCNQVGCQLL